MYNILEELSTVEGPEGPVNYGEEPLCNTLERPYFENVERANDFEAISS